jgi:hypothetical protein
MKKTNNHPAYGMISISRQNSRSMSLFGSKVQHSNYLTIEISTAEEIYDAYSTYTVPVDSLIKVRLSPAQFADLLISANTRGVPCTIERRGGRLQEEIPKPEPVHVEIERDTREELDDLRRKAKELYEMMKVSNPLKVIRAKVTELANEINNGLNSNLDYLFETHVKKLEKVGADIMREAEARAVGDNNTIKQLTQ